MEYPTVTIQGEEYPVLFGRPAIRMYARKKGISDVGNKKLVDLLEQASMDDADLLNWCMLKCGAALKDIEFGWSFEEFQELLTDDPRLLVQLDNIALEQSPVGEDRPESP